MNKGMFVAAVAMLSLAVDAETIKGVVGFSLYPSLADVAEAYEKSGTNDLQKTVQELVEARESLRKRGGVNKAVVELQTLPGFGTLRKVAVDPEGRFTVAIKDDEPDCRLFCRCDVGGIPMSGAVGIDWAGVEKGRPQRLRLRGDYVTATGRCVDTNGNPVAGAVVSVDFDRTPSEQDQPPGEELVGRTDENGCWRVDGIDTPSFERMLSRIADTNVVNRYDSTMPPYGIRVSAVLESKKGIEGVGGTRVPNVSARDRAAAERIFAAIRRKTGRDWPRRAPMTDFPVSTNDVIYVPQITLKAF